MISRSFAHAYYLYFWRTRPACRGQSQPAPGPLSLNLARTEMTLRSLEASAFTPAQPDPLIRLKQKRLGAAQADYLQPARLTSGDRPLPGPYLKGPNLKM